MSATYEILLDPDALACRLTRVTEREEPARTPIARLLRRTVRVTRREVVGHYRLSELDFSVGRRLDGPGRFWLRLNGGSLL